MTDIVWVLCADLHNINRAVLLGVYSRPMYALPDICIHLHGRISLTEVFKLTPRHIEENGSYISIEHAAGIMTLVPFVIDGNVPPITMQVIVT